MRRPGLGARGFATGSRPRNREPRITTSPRRREWLAIGAVALLARAAVFVLCLCRGHWTTADYTARGDTRSYVAVADAMTGGRSYSSLPDYDRRVFPGYPAMIAAVHKLGVRLDPAAFVVTWLAAAVAAAAFAKVFDDARVGWAMTCLVPHYLINSSLGMSEAPTLAVVAVALLASQAGKSWLAGGLLGVAGLTRPMAVFAAAGLLWTLLKDKQTRPAVVTTLSAGATFLAGVAAMHLWTHDVLHGVHVYHDDPGAYAGHLIRAPFYALLSTPRAEPASVFRLIYIWTHVAIVLTAVSICFVRALTRGRTNPRDAISFPWLAGNTAFALCVGEPWGFRHFPRFTIPAGPPLFWTVRTLLPRRARWWIAINIALIWPAAVGVLSAPV